MADRHPVPPARARTFHEEWYWLDRACRWGVESTGRASTANRRPVWPRNAGPTVADLSMRYLTYCNAPYNTASGMADPTRGRPRNPRNFLTFQGGLRSWTGSKWRLKLLVIMGNTVHTATITEQDAGCVSFGQRPVSSFDLECAPATCGTGQATESSRHGVQGLHSGALSVDGDGRRVPRRGFPGRALRNRYALPGTARIRKGKARRDTVA